MDKFNIAEYAENIVQHIISINENILNSKIDRKKLIIYMKIKRLIIYVSCPIIFNVS